MVTSTSYTYMYSVRATSIYFFNSYFPSTRYKAHPLLQFCSSRFCLPRTCTDYCCRICCTSNTTYLVCFYEHCVLLIRGRIQRAFLLHPHCYGTLLLRFFSRGEFSMFLPSSTGVLFYKLTVVITGAFRR